MGVYLYGSEGFYTRAPSGYTGETLDGMEGLLGVGVAATKIGLATQSLIFDEHVERLPNYEQFEGISHLLVAAGYNIPEVHIGEFSDIEGAIYDVCDQWREVIDTIMARPCVPLYLDLAVEDSYTFKREDWTTIIKALGYDVDVEDHKGVVAMRDEIFKTHNTSLRLLAANALLHALEHDLDVMTIIDPREGMSTNLVECMQDSVYMDMSGKEPDRKDRLQIAYFDMISRSDSWFADATKLLQERYDDTLATTMAISLMNKELYDDVLKLASCLEQRNVQVETSLGLRRLKGDAYLALNRLEEARKVAHELAQVGDRLLEDAIREYEERAVQ